MNKALIRKPTPAIKQDLFDLDNIKDAPEDVKSELKFPKAVSTPTQILELFAIKDTLSVNEIIIGLYRKFKIKKARSTVALTVTRLRSQGIIKKAKGVAGSYTLVKDVK
jgi:hypothetical protein